MRPLPTTVRAWLELLRLPNLFTVPGDILVGWALAGARGSPALGIVASLCLYVSGLLLNDWFDVAVDARERPGRPIPSGRVSRRAVLFLAVSLLALGIGLSGSGWVVAGLLALAILAYDGYAKNVPGLGVGTMGLCRALNVLLGAAATWPPPWPPVGVPLFVAAGFFWVYIVLVSVVARGEANPGSEPTLGLRWSPLALVLVLVPLFWWQGKDGIAPIVAVVLLVPILRRRGDVPALVSGLIRFLIPLQAVWLLDAPVSPIFSTALLICWIAAIACGRRFSGS